MAAEHATVFPAYGKALEGCRKKAMLQVHFGADYTTGAYGWTTNLDKVKRSINWQLKNLKTDYIDFGFIHCLDEEADLNTYEKGGVLAYLMDMKSKGVVKHIGLSTHAPALADKVPDKNILDAKKSPFHQALTTAQCIQYALDKPGVVTVLGGPGNVAELKEILAYFDRTDEERDYSAISAMTPDESMGKCVYSYIVNIATMSGRTGYRLDQ